MKLGEWADQQGISRHTAYRWFRNGTLPVPAQRVGNLILVTPDAAPPPEQPGRVALYARVSSHDQRDDLDRQQARLAVWAAQHGLTVGWVIAEVGSGMSDTRTKLRKLLANPDVTQIVVEHRDRFGRMNVGLVEAALSAQGRSITVVEEREVDDDLVRDMTEVLTSFCARLYGKRSARRRAQAALTTASEPPSTS